MHPERYDLNVPATLLLSAAMSLSATAIANADRSPQEVGSAIESVVEGDPNAHLEWHAGLTVPPVVGNISVGSAVQNPGEYKAVDSAVTVPVRRPWALEFSQDPAATKPLTDPELAPVEAVVGDAMQHNKTVTSVEVRGHASDEDDTAYVHGGTNPGLGIHSAKNDALATTRGYTAGPTVKADVEAMTGREVPMTYLPGVEDIDPAFAKRVEELAAREHRTPFGLVVAFNRDPQGLPAEAQQVLGELIDHRRVDVTVHTREMVAVPQAKADDDVKIVPLGLPLLNRTAPEQKVVPTAAPQPTVASGYPKPGLPVPKMKAAQHTTSAPQRQMQPRNHNFSKTARNDGGRMSRSHGGNRSGKRV